MAKKSASFKIFSGKNPVGILKFFGRSRKNAIARGRRYIKRHRLGKLRPRGKRGKR